MTDDARLRARAERAWDKYANGGDVSLAPVATFLMVMTAEFADIAAEARRDAERERDEARDAVRRLRMVLEELCNSDDASAWDRADAVLNDTAPLVEREP